MTTVRGRYPYTVGTSSEAYAVELQLPFKQYSQETLEWFLEILCKYWNLPKPGLKVRKSHPKSYLKYGHYKRSLDPNSRHVWDQIVHEISLDREKGCTIQTLCHEFSHYRQTILEGNTNHGQTFRKQHYQILNNLDKLLDNEEDPWLELLITRIDQEEELNWFWLRRKPIYELLWNPNISTQELLEGLRDYERVVKC